MLAKKLEGSIAVVLDKGSCCGWRILDGAALRTMDPVGSRMR